MITMSWLGLVKLSNGISTIWYVILYCEDMHKKLYTAISFTPGLMVTLSHISYTEIRGHISSTPDTRLYSETPTQHWYGLLNLIWIGAGALKFKGSIIHLAVLESVLSRCFKLKLSKKKENYTQICIILFKGWNNMPISMQFNVLYFCNVYFHIYTSDL
jgi:hypothetical protein